MKLGRKSMRAAMLTGLLLAGGCFLPEYEVGGTNGSDGAGGVGAGGKGGEGGGGGDAQGGGGQGGTGGAMCVNEAPCYTGPAGSQGIGACKDGVVCENDPLKACVGEVLPALDDCKTSEDTDCDGRDKCTGDSLGGKSFPAQDSLLDEAIHSIATMPDGTVFLAGVKDAAMSPITVDMKPSAGKPLLLRLDPSGNLESWSDKITASMGNAIAEAVAVDMDGNVIVAGSFAGTLTIDGTAVQSGGTSDFDAFVVAFDSTGKMLWHKVFGGQGSQAAHAVAVFGGHEVAVTGEYNGQGNFGDGDSKSSSGTDGFVVALDAMGSFRWKYLISDSGTQVGVSLAAGPNDELIVAARSKGGPLLGPINLNDYEMAVLKLSGENGEQGWKTTFGGFGDQNISSVAVSAAGQIAITGHFFTEVKLGNKTYSTGNQTADTFVAVLDMEKGVPVWSRHFGGAGNQIGTSVAFDPLGDVLFGCGFSTIIDFGLSQPEQTTGDFDACVAKFAGSDGKSLFGHSYGDLEGQIVLDVAPGSFGHPWAVGTFNGVLTDTKPELSSTGKFDAFALELAP